AGTRTLGAPGAVSLRPALRPSGLPVIVKPPFRKVIEPKVVPAGKSLSLACRTEPAKKRLSPGCGATPPPQLAPVVHLLSGPPPVQSGSARCATGLDVLAAKLPAPL